MDIVYLKVINGDRGPMLVACDKSGEAYAGGCVGTMITAGVLELSKDCHFPGVQTGPHGHILVVEEKY